MKQFNRLMGITAIICIIALITSGIISLSYIASNKYDFDNIFEDEFYIDFSFHDFDFPSLFSTKKHSSSFETIIKEDSKEFNLVDEISINSSIEKIKFIEESRSNIKIDYYREKPDTKLYKTSYNSKIIDNKLIINSTLSTKNLITNIHYDGYINIYIPKDYKFNKIVIDTSLARISNESIYDNVDTLLLHAKLGDINIDINKPKDFLSIDCDLGDVDINVNSEIKSLDINLNMGSSNIKLANSVEKLICKNNMGEINLDSSGNLENVSLESDMGSITSVFKDHVKTLSASTSMGSIEATFYSNNNSIVYANKKLGSVNSDLPIVNNKTDADFIFTANMGSIDIKTK